MKHPCRSLLGSVLALVAGGAMAEPAKYLFQPPVTIIARDIYDLHTAMMWIITGIFVVVFGVMFYSIWKHRKSVGHKAANFHESTAVEIAWTIVPMIILVGMAFPATSVVLAYKDTSNPDLTIKATGYQWKWGYDYINGEGAGISMLSSMTTPREQIEGDAPKGEFYLREVDNMLTVPVNKKVRILTTMSSTRSGCLNSGSSRMRFQALCVTRGFVPRKKASTAASALSCAARTTDSCRLW